LGLLADFGSTVKVSLLGTMFNFASFVFLDTFEALVGV
jgi:hypothetical protein